MITTSGTTSVCNNDPVPVKTIENHLKSEKRVIFSEKRKRKRKRKRNRRASLEILTLNYYTESFNILYFFIEYDDIQTSPQKLLSYVDKKGYSLSCRYVIPSSSKFTIRFVSNKYINLYARWVILVDENKIFGDTSCRYMKCIQYNQSKYIYIWSDYKLHDIGDCYLQIGTKYNYNIKSIFIPFKNIPLLDICFTPPVINTKTNDTAAKTNDFISDNIQKFIPNPLKIMKNIGEGIKDILPSTNNDNQAQTHDNSDHSAFASPSSVNKMKMKMKTNTLNNLFSITNKESKQHAYHHNIDDISFIVNKNKNKNKKHRKNIKNNKKENELKLRILSRHHPTDKIRIAILDVYNDFDAKMNPYVAYMLKITDDIIDLNGNIRKLSWTIKTRYRKLHSFHKAIQRDKSLKKWIHNEFPSKSLITKMDNEYISERRKKLIAYFDGIQRSNVVKLSNVVYQLVIPPKLVELYKNIDDNDNDNNDQNQKDDDKGKDNVNNNDKQSDNTGKETEKKDDINKKLMNMNPAQPSLPIHMIEDDPGVESDNNMIIAADIPGVFSGGIGGYYEDDEDENDNKYNNNAKDNNNILRPRRGSYPGVNNPKQFNIFDVNRSKNISLKKSDRFNQNNNNLSRSNTPVISPQLSVIQMDALEKDTDKDDDEKQKKQKDDDIKINDDDDDHDNIRFKIEDYYKHLTPALINVIEAFLDLEKRGIFGNSITIVATKMLSLFFDGYISKETYKYASLLNMDETLSFLMNYISDIIWPPPDHKLSTDKTPPPTIDEQNKIREEAKECIIKFCDKYIGENLPKIIGHKEQIRLCTIKFWRFLQQEQLLKDLAFKIIDALLTDLFPPNVSRRHLRRRYFAEKARKEEEQKAALQHKLKKKRELAQRKRDKERSKENQEKLQRLQEQLNSRKIPPSTPPPLLKEMSDPINSKRNKNKNKIKNKNKAPIDIPPPLPRARSHEKHLKHKTKTKTKNKSKLSTNKRLGIIPQNGTIQKSPSPQYHHHHPAHMLQHAHKRHGGGGTPISNRNKRQHHHHSKSHIAGLKHSKPSNSHSKSFKAAQSTIHLNDKQTQNNNKKFNNSSNQTLTPVYRSKSRPLLLPLDDNISNDNIPAIPNFGGLFSGGSMISNFTANLMGKNHNKNRNNNNNNRNNDDDDDSYDSDESDSDESSYEDDESDNNKHNKKGSQSIDYSDDDDDDRRLNKRASASKSVGYGIKNDMINNKKKSNIFQRLTGNNNNNSNKNDKVVEYKKKYRRKGAMSRTNSQPRLNADMQKNQNKQKKNKKIKDNEIRHELFHH